MMDEWMDRYKDDQMESEKKKKLVKCVHILILALNLKVR